MKLSSKNNYYIISPCKEEIMFSFILLVH